MRSNRRQEVRVPCTVPARELGPNSGEARVTNLSSKGLYLQRMTDRPLQYGELVQLQLDLPTGPARLVGRVVRPAEEIFFEAACIKFEIVRPRDQARIDRFLAERGPAPRAVIGRIELRPQRERRSRARARAKWLQHNGAWLPKLAGDSEPIALGG